jgi:hypothetical protein
VVDSLGVLCGILKLKPVYKFLTTSRNKILEVETTGTEDERLLSDTITVSEDEEVTREGVVTGQDGDSFSKKIINRSKSQ